MIYRLEDIAKVLNLTFKSELNFNLPKTEISNFYNKLDVPRNPGYKICRIWTYGFGDMIFRSLDIFLKMYYGIKIWLLRVKF